MSKKGKLVEKKPIQQEKKHGVFLTVFAIIYMIISIVGGLNALWLSYLAHTGQLIHTSSSYLYQSGIIVTLFVLQNVLTFIFTFEIWKWKKWGAYGLFISAVSFPVVYRYIGVNFPLAGSLIGSSILFLFFFFIYRSWKNFE
ncbi:MAG TPA: hypothetical protein VLF89_07985 [Candidatus Saccharimonadales bacterium]|nr:hypothetical protein [Candidatus Saccharimonadales bacterium]